jgi:peptidylprolyl isomerase/peptidyl-prolyl cis-trans isomerase C
MRKKLTTLLLSATLLSSSMAFADDKVIATYKDGEVKESQVMVQFKDALQSQPALKDKKFSDLDRNMQEALLRGYINSKLLEKESANSNVEGSKEFQEKLANMKKQLIQQEIVDKYLKSAVTDKMVDEEYKKIAANMKDKEEIKVSHILVESEETAKDVKKQLNKGGKFADIAAKYSTDQSSKASGGTLGYVMQGQLVPEFEQKAFAMKTGEISDPVKTQFGWHVIKLEDKRKATVPSKDEAKPAIQNKLNRDAMEKFFDELAKKADLKISL